MKEKTDNWYPYPEAEWDEKEQVRYFGDYAAECCLSLLEELMVYAEMPENLKHLCNKAVLALHYILKGNDLPDYPDMKTCIRVNTGLHSLATCLPFLNEEYIKIKGDKLAQASSLIAKRILPALKDFSKHTQFPPDYFSRIYPEIKDACEQWDAVLKEMIYAFTYLATPPEKSCKEDIRRMQIGLHFFAEYLPEMYNL